MLIDAYACRVSELYERVNDDEARRARARHSLSALRSAPLSAQVQFVANKVLALCRWLRRSGARSGIWWALRGWLGAEGSERALEARALAALLGLTST